ncbi:MAG: asparagine synthase (glutamine-hydrolyzing) [Candidatus Zambryskibacteria bacterium]|nr:asparagine synthase (glutamine-hydrolyzing) [Candidatus Zambryskibacteria bacterium]
MCGIAGVIGATTTKKEELITKMTEVIHHRGPDQDGFFCDQNVGLGMRRLSIIDISAGKQPIENADSSLLIFFNGEIYNYKELRAELLAEGRIFKTHSDTEVILQMYEAHGPKSVSRLRGMFAFSIYNKHTGKLFIARDFFGIKPLYYWKPASSNGEIKAFGSEIKSILEHPEYKKEVNHEAVFNYLRFQYNPIKETFFKDIFTLAPGHTLTIDTKAGTHKIEQYWDFSFAPDNTRDLEETKKEIVDTLRDSVAHHMISEVPVGSFLSGGVDSSIIATLMNEVIQKEKPGSKNSTFTVGFDVLTEGKEAATTSDFLGTDHTEVTIDPSTYWSVLPKLVWHFDEPVADPSAIALYFVAKEARKKVTVVLSGEGADELFGGYNIYLQPIDQKSLSWIPAWFLKVLTAMPFEFWGKNHAKRALQKLEDWYIGNASIFTNSQIKKLWKGEQPPKHSLAPLYEKAQGNGTASDSEKMQYIDIHTWLVGDILAKADKMTMANSLELRVPFLDIEVTKLARTLPDSFKWKNGVTKYALREAFKGIIPEETRHRRKLGFPTPIRVWLRDPACPAYAAIRESKYIQEHLNIDFIEQLIKEHTSNTKDNARHIYILYMLALWYRVFMEK